MAELGKTFDASLVEPSTPFEVLPAGDYTVEIVADEMRDTKAGTGQYLWIDMIVTQGQFSGRHLYDRLNIRNPNKTAEDIAEKTLSAISRAVNVITYSNSDGLHFKPLIVTVKVKPSGPDKTGVDRDAQNEIKKYSAVNGAQPVNNAAPKSAPWKRTI